MRKRLMILDTSMLLVWLQVPEMETCDADGIGFHDVEARIADEQTRGTKFVLPLAVVIEAGNHISQIKSNDAQKRRVADQFIQLIRNAVQGISPWFVFSNQIQLFEDEKLLEMLTEWRENINALSIGDITVKRVADFYCSDQTEVVIYTCDQHLRAYSPVSDIPTPRRRQR